METSNPIYKITLPLILTCFCCFTLDAQSSKSKLYVLSIGIKDYKDDFLDLNYADKDANEVADAFRKMTDIYNVQSVRTLLNESATRLGIKGAFEQMAREVNHDDLFILFYSGHGSRNKLIPHDFRFDDPTATSLHQDDLLKWLDELGCSYSLLMDACHSGSMVKGERIKDGEADAQEEIDKLYQALNSSEKVKMMVGSSSTDEVSFECYSCENGYFTQCILDAFENKVAIDKKNKKYLPDDDKDGVISYYEFLQYVQDAVRIMTNEANLKDPKIKLQKPFTSVKTNQNVAFIKPIQAQKDVTVERKFEGSEESIPERPAEPKIQERIMEAPTVATPTLSPRTPLDPVADTDKDGIFNKEDSCPETYGIPMAKGCPDADGDMIWDFEDNCPDAAGQLTGLGCPDSDGDGILDADDACPQTRGLKTAQGCPDSDNDGVSDAEDNCPNQPGDKSAKGCLDADGDGVADDKDSCPQLFGHISARGCPDTDGDGIVDVEDACPEKAGKMSASGCPDADGDGIQDIDDECKDVPGVKSAAGCPDKDNDGIADGQDKCPNQPGKKSSKGCPDMDSDGVADNEDHCPKCFGKASAKGCPDEDGDTFADAEDECPGLLGKGSAKGCPDADEDGVKDEIDQCKYWFGRAVFNGCEDYDEDGIADIEDFCPEEKGVPGFFGCSSKESYSMDPFKNEMVQIYGGSFKANLIKKIEVGSFYISKAEVTQAQWYYVMADNPSQFIGCYNCPVESVSFEDVEKFISRLNQRTGQSYRLPTEAEWEYAAKGGDDGKKSDYAGSKNLKEVGWYEEISGSKPHPIGKKSSNRLGLFDMSGGVWEWCSDYYSSKPFEESGDSSRRVIRGGGYTSTSEKCKVESREDAKPSEGYNNVGFRLAKSN